MSDKDRAQGIEIVCPKCGGRCFIGTHRQLPSGTDLYWIYCGSNCGYRTNEMANIEALIWYHNHRSAHLRIKSLLADIDAGDLFGNSLTMRQIRDRLAEIVGG